jgi:hypothetical protein
MVAVTPPIVIVLLPGVVLKLVPLTAIVLPTGAVAGSMLAMVGTTGVGVGSGSGVFLQAAKKTSRPKNSHKTGRYLGEVTMRRRITLLTDQADLAGLNNPRYAKLLLKKDLKPKFIIE